MVKNKKIDTSDTRFTLLRITRVHYFYLLAYIFSIIIFDSWNLLTHDSVAQRWTLAGTLLVINTIIWYLCKSKVKNDKFYRVLLIVLLVSDIIFAAVNVYWQRGFASKSVMLFAVPVISASLVKSRSLLLATTATSAVVYSISAVRYFNANYGQGYRIELYGEVFFYCALLFVLAWLLLINFRSAKD